MNKKFRNSKAYEITFTDDGIIYGMPSVMDENERFEQLIPYGRIKDIKFSKTFGIPSFDIIDKETVDGKLNINHGYLYEMDQKDELKEMIPFAKERMKSVPSIQPSAPPKKPNIQVYETEDFKYKNGEIRIGKGLFAKRIPVSSITTCDGMSYYEDVAFHQYKITFNAGKDRYIIKGRTYDAVRDIPLEEYYENIVRNSGMPEAEKATALNNKTYDGVELLAKALIKQAGEPITAKEKDASVVGRAIAGAAIAGPTGAIVGALSAVDKNNKNKK